MRRASSFETILLSAATCAIVGCTTPGSHATAWEARTCFRSRAPIERIRCGRPDASDASLQAVSVDQAGTVALIHFERGEPRAEVLHENGTELTGLAIGDVDERVAGDEIYVGGYLPGKLGEENGGIVLQIAVSPSGGARASVRRIHTGDAYVHSIEIVPPRAAGDHARLLVSTYAGEVHLLAPTPGDAPWNDRVLYRDARSDDPERTKIKDAGMLRDPQGRAPHEALIAFKLGRLLWIDVDAPESARFVHDEPGGLSRVTPDADGGAYVTGYAGRVMHFVREGAGFRIDVLDQETADSGLRGCVVGDFPAGRDRARFAIFGFHKLCRALVPRLGVLDPFTLYVDVDKGHAIEAGDVVPGNGADELLIGGYSKRVTLLVAR